MAFMALRFSTGDGILRMRGCRAFIAAVALFAAGAGGADDERFGVMTHFAQGWEPSLIPLVASGDIRQVRDELYWNTVEAEQGVFKFPPAYDAYLDGLARRGITPLIVLSFENRHYDGGETPHTPEAFAAYARYAVEVLRRCGRQVRAVEIWNEYNGSFSRGPATADRAATYLQMLRVVYAAIKRERPDVTVVAGATAGIPLPYWEKLLAGGGLDCMDALSIHPYRYDATPEGIERDIAGLRELVVRFGPAKPIWVTEIGWQLKPAAAAGDLVIDEATQARFLTRGYALLLSAGVERIYWYLFRDDQEFTMGLVRHDAGLTPKPAYYAMAALIRHLQGATFVRREPTATDIYSLVFRNAAGTEKRVLWSLTPRRLSLQGATAAADLTGDPVLTAGELPLDDSPLLVTGPLRGLPPPVVLPPVLADSARDFSREPGAWAYGFFEPGGTEFRPLPLYEVTDWKAQWTGGHPYASITASDQHPSFAGDQPVTVVRRWRSDHTGRVHVTGSFRCGTQGDGVGVGLLVDGRTRFRKLLGHGAATVEEFDCTFDVRPGTTLDFAIDPGPAANIDFDATAVAVVIRPEP